MWPHNEPRPITSLYIAMTTSVMDGAQPMSPSAIEVASATAAAAAAVDEAIVIQVPDAPTKEDAQKWYDDEYTKYTGKYMPPDVKFAPIVSVRSRRHATHDSQPSRTSAIQGSHPHTGSVCPR